MERLCFTFKIYPGQEAEYKRRHDEIWPELVEAIEAAGLRNYSLFRREQDAFAQLADNEANARWSEWFEDVIVSLTDESGELITLAEVWHLD
jgi:L-rhamnose mutarotase